MARKGELLPDREETGARSHWLFWEPKTQLRNRVHFSHMIKHGLELTRMRKFVECVGHVPWGHVLVVGEGKAKHDQSMTDGDSLVSAVPSRCIYPTAC